MIGSYKRLLKSYVIRNKKLNPSQLQKLEILSEKYCLKKDDGNINLAKAFGDNREVICDIGFGRGDSLLAQAKSHENYNYLGAEVYTPGIINVLSHIESEQYANMKLWHGDAVDLIYNHIAADSFNRVQLLYPDPWPKARHHKRRIISAEFVDQVIRAVKNHGYFYFVTDWQLYADYVEELLLYRKELIKVSSIDARPDIEGTKYATKGKAKGHAITELIYKINKA